MAFSQALAASFARRYTVDELETYLATASEVAVNKGRGSIGYEGSNISINGENADSVIEMLEEALRIKAAEARGNDPELNAPAASVSLDRRYHRIT